jgi:hypothetical protein
MSRLWLVVLLLSTFASAKDTTTREYGIYQHGTYLGAFIYKNGIWDDLTFCGDRTCSGAGWVEAESVGAKIKDDAGVTHLFKLHTIKGWEERGDYKGQLQTMKAGDSVEFKIDKHVKTEVNPSIRQQLTHGDQRTYSQLYIRFPNGRVEKFYGISEENGTTSATSASQQVNDIIQERLKMSASFISVDALRLLCQNTGMYKTPYPQVYCDELKKREAAAK